MRIDGTCHCGAIAYEADVAPEHVYFCHCADCQALSGGSGRWSVPVPAERLRLLRGTPCVYVKTGDSGRESHQSFCGACATPLYGSAPHDGHATLRLRLGTARQRASLPPRLELWCASAQPWARVTEARESRERQ